MSFVGLASAGVFALSALLIGVRLFALGLRRSAWPEGLIGLAFLLIGIGDVLLVSAAAVADGRPAELPLLIALGIIDVGFAAIALFSWYVFHRASFMGSLITALLVGANLFIAAASPWIPAFPDGTPGPLPLRGALRFTIFVWSAITSLRYYAKMKRRLALGLADPLVTDRFRLWGLFMAGGAALLVLLTTAGVLKLRNHFLFPVFGLAGMLVGWSCIGLLWLSFTPPRWYCDRAAARAAAPEDS